MPSARKRRLRSIIKGYINRIGPDGSLVNATASEQISESQSLNELDEADLKTVLAIESLGTGAFPNKITYDADADNAFGTADFKPFDIREQVDTEGRGVGDSQLTANLYVEMLSLQTEISTLNSSSDEALTAVQNAQTVAANNTLPGGNLELWCGAVSAQLVASSEASTLKASIDTKLAPVVSLETRIGTLATPYDPATSMQVAGDDYNVEDIQTTEAEAVKTNSSTEISLVGSMETVISASVSTVNSLEVAPGKPVGDC